MIRPLAEEPIMSSYSSSCHTTSPSLTENSKEPRIVKAGLLKRYKKGFLSKGFKVVYAELVDNSYLLWYRDQSRYKRDGAVLLSRICDFLAVGPYSRNIPGRPNLPKGASERHVIAVPSAPSREASVHWFLCHSDNDLNEWMTNINSVLPPLPPPSHPPPDTADLRDPPPPYPGGAPEIKVQPIQEDSFISKGVNGDVNNAQPKRMISFVKTEDKSSDATVAVGAVVASAWGWTWGWGGGWGCGGWGCFDFGPLPNNQLENGGGGGDLNDGYGGMRNGDVQTNSNNDCGMSSSEQPNYDLDYDQPDIDPGYDAVCDGGGAFDAGFDAGGFDLGFSVGF